VSILENKSAETSRGIKWVNDIAKWNLRYELVLNGASRFQFEFKPDYIIICFSLEPLSLIFFRQINNLRFAHG
jgi:hypothetical protein